MQTGWKHIAAGALAIGMTASTAQALDIGGFASTNSGGKGIAAGNYSSTTHRSLYSTETTGSITPGRSASQGRRPVNCPAPPKPGALRTQGGNSGTTISTACPAY